MVSSGMSTNDYALEISWNGIALVWDCEVPVLDSVTIEEPEVFEAAFGCPASVERARQIVDEFPRELLDLVSSRYDEMAAEEGYRRSFDAATGSSRWVRS